jgi:hypothetical protein
MSDVIKGIRRGRWPGQPLSNDLIQAMTSSKENLQLLAYR